MSEFSEWLKRVREEALASGARYFVVGEYPDGAVCSYGVLAYADGGRRHVLFSSERSDGDH